MNILLINPSLLSSQIQHYSKTLEKNRGNYPSLGLSYVASSLLKNNHNVIVVDCDTENNYLKQIEQVLASNKIDLVGFYVMTWTFRQVLSLFEKIKEKQPDVISVIGGPNACSFPRISLELSKFDFAIQGEGEEAIVELVNCLQSKGDFSQIKGLIWRKGNEIIENPLREYRENLDDIDFPCWDKLPVFKYQDVFTQNRHFVTMIATRGCPFNCTFCDRKNRMGRLWRSRSPENIIKEIKLLNNNFKIKEVMFFDDNFIMDKAWVYRFCDEILANDLDIVWECRARVDLVDKNLLKAMKKSGCYRIRYGMESGDNRILKILKKDISVEQIIESTKISKESGIEIFAYFMMGLPHETEETLQKTLDLALKVDADFTLFSKTILIVGSELFEWAVSEGYINHDYWVDYLKGKETDPAPSLSTKELPEEVVDKYVSLANKKFYLRSNYILKRIKKIKSINQLLRQAQMAGAFLK